MKSFIRFRSEVSITVALRAFFLLGLLPLFLLPACATLAPAQLEEMHRNLWNRHYKAQPFSGVIPGKVALEFADPDMPEPFTTYFRAAHDQVRRDMEASMETPLPPGSA